GKWDEEALLNHLSPEDAQVVRNVPLLSRSLRDRIYWGRERPVWRMLWDLGGPPKPSHFAWRACRGVIVVNGALASHYIGHDSGCSVCVVKMNADAAVMGESGVRLEVVIRGAEGEMFTIAVSRIKENWDPALAKAVAAQYEVIVVCMLGYVNAWLESDALGVVGKV
ncbi:Histone transcription regulator 3-like protein, partial [Bienertia sinuspersici]